MEARIMVKIIGLILILGLAIYYGYVLYRVWVEGLPYLGIASRLGEKLVGIKFSALAVFLMHIGGAYAIYRNKKFLYMIFLGPMMFATVSIPFCVESIGNNILKVITATGLIIIYVIGFIASTITTYKIKIEVSERG
ncbi:hypothetical protein J4526_08675 [Desulfurococcaceae archaeon MEX13E-LK6-19]|nr:hypothetical protein J4526_08675 [Desulfurococcaceae archaeon MEX13E-LK6-19]